MAKCRHCERSGLTVRTNKRGLCKPCDTEIQLDVERKLGQVKEALVYIRCSSDPEVQESFCDTAIETAETLEAYDRRSLAEISPSPGALLAMLRGKRAEAVAARPPRAEVVRPVEGGTAFLAAIQEPHGIEPEPGPADRAEVDGAQDWWAWESPSPAPGNGDEARGEERHPVACLALLDPGSIRGSLSNISPGGLFLQSDKLHTPGRSVSLIISTPRGPAKAEGLVRWVQTDSLSGAEPGMGIEFTEVTDQLQTYLSTRLGCSLAVPGPPPAPPAQVAQGA